MDELFVFCLSNALQWHRYGFVSYYKVFYHTVLCHPLQMRQMKRFSYLETCWLRFYEDKTFLHPHHFVNFPLYLIMYSFLHLLYVYAGKPAVNNFYVKMPVTRSKLV